MTALIAEQGKYRVVAVDTFDGTDWVIGDYDTVQEATAVAKKEGGEMKKTHVYNDKGKHLFDSGRF